MSILESTRKMTTNEKMCYDMGYAQGKQDAVPVVRGEWIPAKDPYDRVYCYRHAGCGCEHNEQSAYCPNCGAKMEVEP